MLDSGAGMDDVFSDINNLSKGCRFENCTHQHEPGCAVLDALNNGTLSGEKYENYTKLVKENNYNSMSALEKREKDRKFGKFIKTVKNN